jgi:hypothetical protein
MTGYATYVQWLHRTRRRLPLGSGRVWPYDSPFWCTICGVEGELL